MKQGRGDGIIILSKTRERDREKSYLKFNNKILK